MTNFEAYKDEILEITKEDSIAINADTHVLCGCGTIDCNQCAFKASNVSYCIDKCFEWLYSEYKEPPKVDWSTIKVDTPVLVRNHDDNKWEKRYFAKYENGEIYCFYNGQTSWTSDGNVYSWLQGKLV